MGEFGSEQLVVFFLSLAALLATAHTLGELARRLGQPPVIGEMIAGVLLGPTILGMLAPGVQAWLFPVHTAASIGLSAIITLAVVLLLLVAGMEVDLSTIWLQGRTTIFVSIAGVLVPLSLGILAAVTAPRWWGMPADGSVGPFAVFLGTALAISALPVIAKVLMDLDLFQADIGMTVLVSCTICNLAAWLSLSTLLGKEGGLGVWTTITLSLGFTTFMLTLGRQGAHRILPWVQAHLSWPGGVLGFLIVAALLGAAVTEFIGIHAIFGAFLVGIALGDSSHLREHTRHIVIKFVDGVLAPIFVASIGLGINVFANFDPLLIVGVLLLGTLSKVLGCALASRFGRLSWPESWAVGWAMNARGEMGIVIGLLAWEAGLIDERLFVGLVTLAFVSSATAAPFMSRSLRRQRSRSLATLLESRNCVLDLAATDWASALRQLSAIAASRTDQPSEAVAQAVLERELLMTTGLGHGIAVPHARLPGLKSPVVAVGLHREGLDFNAPDAEPVHLLFLVLTPVEDAGAQVQILGEIARLLHDPVLRQQAMSSRTTSELLAALRIGDALKKAEFASAEAR